MPYVLDNVYAYKFLKMLVTPFKDTDAFKMGIIDADGNNLIKYTDLTDDDQRKAYNYLVRLVFNLKKMINKLPGGENQFKNYAAAILMLRESENGSMYPIDINRLQKIAEWLESNGILLEEMRDAIRKEIKEEVGAGAVAGGGDAGGVANMTGAGVSTDIPAIRSALDSGVKRFVRRKRRKQYDDSIFKAENY